MYGRPVALPCSTNRDRYAGYIQRVTRKEKGKREKKKEAIPQTSLSIIAITVNSKRDLGRGEIRVGDEQELYLESFGTTRQRSRGKRAAVLWLLVTRSFETFLPSHVNNLWSAVSLCWPVAIFGCENQGQAF